MMMIKSTTLALILSPLATANVFDQSLAQPCITESSCNDRRKELGITKFYTDADFERGIPSKGCFQKGDSAFWSEGTVEEMSSDDSLTGKQTRIYCMPDGLGRSSGGKICAGEEECDVMRQQLGFGSFYVDSSFPSKGCFYKNDKAYFGTGGSADDESKANLPGAQTRIYCDDLVLVNDENLESIELELEAGGGGNVNGASSLVSPLSLGVALGTALFAAVGF